jgi:hypothetical protein
MSLRVAAAAAVILLCLAACEADDEAGRYDVHLNQQGHLFRLDRQTGSVAVRYGEKLIVLEEVPGGESSPEPSELGQVRTYRDLRIPELDVTASLATMHEQGLLHYRIELRPHSEAVEQAPGRRKLQFRLTRKGGFLVEHEDLHLSQFVSIVDAEGKVQRLEHAGWSGVPAERYRGADDWTLTLSR